MDYADSTPLLAVPPEIALRVRTASSCHWIKGPFLAYMDCMTSKRRDAPVAPLLQGGDVLWFAGDVHGVTFLLRMPGLRHYERKHVEKAGLDILERRLVQNECNEHEHVEKAGLGILRHRLVQ
eukprot:1152434-Pelagomonas_calceolata.AAC.4